MKAKADEVRLIEDDSGPPGDPVTIRRLCGASGLPGYPGAWRRWRQKTVVENFPLSAVMGRRR